MQAELSNILDHVETIQGLDLDALEPTSHAIPLRNVIRADDVRDSLPQEEALQNAPRQEDGRFRVPRIIEDA